MVRAILGIEASSSEIDMRVRTLLIAPLVILAVALPASADEASCNRFRLEGDPAVQIEIGTTTVTIDDRGEKLTFDQIITKRFGRLMSATVESSDADALEHYFQIKEIGGRETLIYDSQIFLPACD